jgi:hypothetical protein
MAVLLLGEAIGDDPDMISQSQSSQTPAFSQVDRTQDKIPLRSILAP